MKLRYFAKQELETYFKAHKLPADLFDQSTMGISSIADLVEICNQYKYDNNSKFLDDLKIFEDGPCFDGSLFVSELDQHKLSSSLFENESDDDKFCLWLNGTDRNTPPLHSVRCLTLRVTDYVFWDLDVFQEMLSNFE